MDLAIGIKIGSPLSDLQKVKTTIESIIKKIGTKEYKIIILLAPIIPEHIKEYIYRAYEEHNENIILLPEEDLDWPVFINKAINIAEKMDCEYFIEAHDDIELLTDGFFPKTKKIVEKIQEPVGWISFTDKGYLFGFYCPPVREGFHIDYRKEKAWEKRKLFQFHNLPDDWWKKKPWHSNKKFRKLNLDYPKGPVKCHAPYSDLSMIKMDVLKEIGPCDNISNYTLLVDEDWGLRALKLGLFNIWIPDICFIHHQLVTGKLHGLKGYKPVSIVNEIGKKFHIDLVPFWNKSIDILDKFTMYVGGDTSHTRSSVPNISKEEDIVHKRFVKKWGFHEGRVSDDELEEIREKYKDTNIPWSSYRRSYEWDYVKMK